MTNKIIELCPHCENETELLNAFEVQECKECGEKIKPCGLCYKMKCKKCPLGGGE